MKATNQERSVSASVSASVLAMRKHMNDNMFWLACMALQKLILQMQAMSDEERERMRIFVIQNPVEVIENRASMVLYFSTKKPNCMFLGRVIHIFFSPDRSHGVKLLFKTEVPDHVNGGTRMGIVRRSLVFADPVVVASTIMNCFNQGRWVEAKEVSKITASVKDYIFRLRRNMKENQSSRD